MHVPRTGGTAVRHALDIAQRKREHWRSVYWREQFGVQAWRELFTFTIVRNPFDRLVSLCAFLHRSSPGALDVDTFRAWVRAGARTDALGRVPVLYAGERTATHVCAPQTAYTSDVRCVLFYEHLAAAMRELFHVELARENASARGRDYRVYYDRATIDRAARMYKSDLDAYGYSFGLPLDAPHWIDAQSRDGTTARSGTRHGGAAA